MISFFRKIRQKLLEENRVTRYLIYALGEILLVVIGILIAVYVNNVSQQNADRAKELSYLMGIHTDIKSQIDELNDRTEISNNLIRNIEILLDEFSINDAFVINDSTSYRLVLVNRSTSPEKISTTFSEITYSGDIKLIQNKGLKNNMVQFYQQLDMFIVRSSTNSENIFQRQIYPTLLERTLMDISVIEEAFNIDFNLKTPSKPYSERIKKEALSKLGDPKYDVELLNALTMKAIIEALQRERASATIESANILMLEIEKEINDRFGEAI